MCAKRDVATALLYKNRILEVVVEPVEVWAECITQWLYSRYDVFYSVDPLWSLDEIHRSVGAAKETDPMLKPKVLVLRIK